jgi:hypothetical protein
MTLGGEAVVFLLIAVALAGLIIGTRFRTPALLAASAAAAAAGVGIGLAAQWAPGWTFLIALAAVIVLDVAYLVGLFGSLRLRRRSEGRR